MSNEKLFEGPVQQWKPDAEDVAAIENMLVSEDELTRAYGEAYKNGCWIREWGSGDATNPGSGLTAVGDFNKLAEIEFRTGTKLDQNEFGLGDCVNLAFPGSGETRIERVRDGMRQVLEARGQDRDSESLDLFGSFTENGYKVDAYTPKDSAQKRQWTVRIYKEGEDEVFREETIPMIYEPIFGVDVGDKAALETRMDEIMRELAR